MKPRKYVSDPDPTRILMKIFPLIHGRANCGASVKGFCCTLTYGHSGIHVAHVTDGSIVAIEGEDGPID